MLFNKLLLMHEGEVEGQAPADVRQDSGLSCSSNKHAVDKLLPMHEGELEGQVPAHSQQCCFR
jgi:hypothetical protein